MLEVPSLKDSYNNADFAYKVTVWMHLENKSTLDAAEASDLPEAFIYNNLARNAEAKRDAIKKLKGAGVMARGGAKRLKSSIPMTGGGIADLTYAGQVGPAHDPELKCHECRHWGNANMQYPRTKFEAGKGKALDDQPCTLARKFDRRSREFPYDAISCKSFAARSEPLEVYEQTGLVMNVAKPTRRTVGANEGPDPFK